MIHFRNFPLFFFAFVIVLVVCGGGLLGAKDGDVSYNSGGPRYTHNG